MVRQLIGKKAAKSPQKSHKIQTPKIYFSISSEGYGHSSRAKALASEFPKSEVLIGTYDYALDRMKQIGLPSIEISHEYRMIGTEGRFEVSKTILENQSSLITLNQVVQEERDIMEKHHVTLVVADGRIAPVIAAYRLGVPCLVLTNQSNFYSFFQCQESPLVRLFGKSFEWWLGWCLSFADEIVVPDYFPPESICLYNLSTNVHMKKNTRFIGPLVSWKASEIKPVERPKGFMHYVVVSLGGHAYRTPLLEAVLSIASEFPDVYFEVLTSLPCPKDILNVGCKGLVAESAPYFKAADCVITQAGHSTAMELSMLGTPMIVVPDLNQSEQENNAFQLESLGLALRLTYPHLQKSSKILASALDKILKSDRYHQAAQKISALGSTIQAKRLPYQLLSDYAGRLIAY